VSSSPFRSVVSLPGVLSDSTRLTARPSPIFFLIVSTAGVVHAVRGGRHILLATAIAAGFCSGGVLLARTAWRDAWRPTLRIAFESIARSERSDARRAGGTVPGTDAEDAASVVLVGELRSDASATDGGGVSLPIDVADWPRRVPARGLDTAANPVDGGVLLTGRRRAGRGARTRLARRSHRAPPRRSIARRAI
jgi:hypothetical protein